MLYCYVKEGKVINGPRRLPAEWFGWKLAELSDDQRREMGWLPCNALVGVRCTSPTVYADRVEYAVDLTGLRLQKGKEISAAFDREEVAPFVSSALGEPHAYGVKIDQRVDLLGSGLIGRPIDYSCRRLSDGVKASYPHTAVQMQQVLTEGAAWRENLVARLNSKLAAIAAATTAAEIAAIAWT